MVSSWMDWRLAASREENGRRRREREVEQPLEPLIPVPPSFALALCGPDSLPGGQAHWTVGGQWTLHWTLHRSARISARTTPPSLSPTTEALYFATAICAVSLGVGSKLMELVRFLSLTFSFLSCIPYPQVLPAHPEKPGWGGAQGRVLPTPSPFTGFHLGGSVKSHGLVGGHWTQLVCISALAVLQQLSPASLVPVRGDSVLRGPWLLRGSRREPYRGFFGTENPTVQNSLSRRHLDMTMQHVA